MLKEWLGPLTNKRKKLLYVRRQSSQATPCLPPEHGYSTIAPTQNNRNPPAEAALAPSRPPSAAAGRGAPPDLRPPARHADIPAVLIVALVVLVAPRRDAGAPSRGAHGEAASPARATLTSRRRRRVTWPRRLPARRGPRAVTCAQCRAGNAWGGGVRAEAAYCAHQI